MPDADDLAALIDLIYEAAVVPEKWPHLLGRLSQRMDGSGGILFTAGSSGTAWTASPDIWPVFDEFLRDGWHAINPRPQRLGRLNHPGFVRDSDHFTPEEIAADPVYQNFYFKRGLGWAMGTMLQVPSGDALVFSFERAFARGVVEMEHVHFFDQLRPHLARAALLGAHFGLVRAKAMAEALAQSGLPAAVLRGRGRLYATNALFDALMPGLVQDGPSRLQVSSQAADRLFAEAAASIQSGGAGRRVYSIPVPADGAGRAPAILHLLPVRREAYDVLNSASALLIVTSVDRSTVPTAEVVAGLFDLTPAEARVARRIAEGATVDAIAIEHGLSRETVRTHLKQTFAKVGVTRQAELAALLGGLALLPPG
ncbi:helix-turn-helix transcriptional regulator [Xanthobacter sp. V3C-3]|uniref:helix-turn-helix transcriptional regulator n=1 Tax=Xanthobacter lutulentifluminis TaxID=3119935 RepID=UPI00372A4375